MEDWKDDILNSTRGMTKAAPPSGAFDQILLKVKSPDQKEKPSRGWMAVAAMVSFIVLLNAFIIVQYNSSRRFAPPESANYSVPLITSYNIYQNE